MHGPVKPLPLLPSAAMRPCADQPSPGRALEGDEREQLRHALHMVLNMSVYDCAGRAVTVKDMLRGSLATRVRVALDPKRTV